MITDPKFKPMLSATCEDISTIKYPVLVSPKLDGIRCLITGGIAVSRNLKPIPNTHIQAQLKGLPDGLDGELIVGRPTGDDVWNRSQSGVMSKDGEPDFTYWVFDLVGNDAFAIRLGHIDDLIHSELIPKNTPMTPVPHKWVAYHAELAAFEQLYVGVGYEGVMIRDPHAKYKFGRSTLKEGGLMKLKRWYDDEATVIGVVERQHNGNAAHKDALGHTKRTTHKANKTPRGDLGALICRLGENVEFEVGSGFTDEQRSEFWLATVVGRTITFKFQSLSPDGVPRFPVFKGFRDMRDMST